MAQNLFDHAFTLHRAGKLAEAEVGYKRVLAAQPRHVEALRLRGIALCALHRVDEGLASLRAAVAAQPNSPDAHYSLANALFSSGSSQAAVSSYQAAITLRPNFPEALWNLGNAHAALECWPAAVDAFQKAAVAAPKNVTILNNLSVAYRKTQRFDDALNAARRALTLEPKNVDALNNIGIAHKEAGRIDEAIAAYDRAVAVDPRCYEAWYNRALAFGSVGKHADEALSYQRALAVKPDAVSALLGLGAAYQDLKQWDEAAQAYRRCVELSPGSVVAWRNLATIYQRRGSIAEAIAAYRKAIAAATPDRQLLDSFAGCLLEQQPEEQAIADLRNLVTQHPECIVAWTNIAGLHFRRGELAEAEAAFRQATSLAPDVPYLHQNLGNFLATIARYEDALAEFEYVIALNPALHPARLNIGLMKLVTGHLAEGWPGYEARLEGSQAEDKHRFAHATRWTNAIPLSGKTLFVHAEQGLGDTIQFVRYVPLLAAQGAKVIVEVHPPLLGLLKQTPGAERVIAQGEPVPPSHLHCPLLSLPLELGTRLETIPPVLPLSAPVDKIAAWAEHVLTPPARLRVGMVWSGNLTHVNDRNRSIRLSAFRRIIDATPDCHFFSLQKNPTAADAADLATIAHVTNIGTRFADFTDTAAVIAHLDVVITVDTSVAHLAGAMGKPVWLLLPVAPDWRWLVGRSDSPWYPSATLFRQSTFGDWENPFSQIIAKLASLRAAAP